MSIEADLRAYGGMRPPYDGAEVSEFKPDIFLRAADRIEALEAALREIELLDDKDSVKSARYIARATLRDAPTL